MYNKFYNGTCNINYITIYIHQFLVINCQNICVLVLKEIDFETQVNTRHSMPHSKSIECQLSKAQ